MSANKFKLLNLLGSVKKLSCVYGTLEAVSEAPNLVGNLLMKNSVGKFRSLCYIHVDLAVLISFCRESEGIFEHGNYRKEADDLHSVVEHFSGTSRVASVILGHSKGALVGSHYQYVKSFDSE